MSERGSSGERHPLVHAPTELRLLAAGQAALGVLGLLLAIGLGDVGRFSALEVASVLLVFGISVGGAVGGLVLGRRTGPAILYRQLLERAPPAPASASGEGVRRTAARALGVAAGTAAGFLGLAALLVALSLAGMGKPRAEVPAHLTEEAALVAAGWLLVCAGVSRLIASWFSRWERQRDLVVLCAPLRSATMGPVYFVAPPR